VDAREQWYRRSGCVEPDPRHRAVYDELYGVYRSLYENTRDQVHRLAQIQLDGSA
jgi:xylulokinase